MGNFATGIAAKVYLGSSNDFILNTKAIIYVINEKLEKRDLVIHFLNEFDKDLIESIMFAAYGNFGPYFKDMP